MEIAVLGIDLGKNSCSVVGLDGVGRVIRLAATAMLLQVLFLPMTIADPGLSVAWAVLLGWLIVAGPKGLSLDHLFRPGLRRSALPGIALITRGFAWWNGIVAPVYLLALRLWLAAVIAWLAIAASYAAVPHGIEWLPRLLHPITAMPRGLNLLLSLMFALGLALRPVALLLALLAPISQAVMPGDLMVSFGLIMAVLVINGAGRLSLDGRLSRWLRARPGSAGATSLPHVVVVGGGFGGVAVVEGLGDSACRVTLIDRRNHHLFQPLLYQVATAGLSPADIATPIREMFRNHDNVRVILGEVTGVDAVQKTVQLHHASVPYDYLVLATGAQHSYFGRDAWSALAPGLKSIDDAINIRRRLLLAFEEAENSDDDDDRQAWLTFVIVGGGPTGVELAGAVVELARSGFTGEFRRIDPIHARVILVEAGERLLAAFPPKLSADAERALSRLGVEILVGSKVEDVEPESVTVSGSPISARTVLWAAGVMASPAARWLSARADRSGRLIVDTDLSVPGLADVFAIGDTAACSGWNGHGVPGLAPAAKQEGHYVSQTIRARVAGRPFRKQFRYRHLGSLATIGRQSAVAEFGPVWFRGALAWWIWGAVHITFLVGGRNRLVVALEWLWAYLTFRRGTRLITGPL